RVRRFRCRQCGAIVTAAPRAVVSGALYGAVAIGLALSLWAHALVSGAAVRQRVSPWRPGCELEHGWRSLARWARNATRWWGLVAHAGPPRDVARHVTSQLAARAVALSGPIEALACAAVLGR